MKKPIDMNLVQLKAENIELKTEIENLKAQIENYKLSENEAKEIIAELKAKNKWYSEQVCNKECAEVWGGYNKANEWHYMKDVNCYEDLHFPPEEEEKGRVLIWKVQVITEKRIKEPVSYHCGSYGDLWYEINAYHVIAWKEIVLPELPKESE